ncbi:MAG TPA: hypothetical protein DCR93_08310 [Cytophagales bacterium]|nr:hypothetical protein [Cytophagales bacterium]
MAKVNGKTARLLNRLPHFYAPEELEKTFRQAYETLGQGLEWVEQDLFAALRAHHVPTAENVGSKGYTADPTEHGDLDKLFSLYLETVGGTSQLVKMNPEFTSKSFYVEKLVNALYETNEEYLVQLRDKLLLFNEAEFGDLVARYRTAHAWVKAEEISPSLVFALLTKNGPLPRYWVVSLGEDTRQAVMAYTGDGKLSEELVTQLVTFFNNQVLKDPFLYAKNADYFDGLFLDDNTVRLRNALNKDFLMRRWERQFEENPETFNNSKTELETQLNILDFTEQPSQPAMLDTVRLNRLLLEAASAHQATPWGFASRAIPSVRAVRQELKHRFNKLLTADQTEVNTFFGSIESLARTERAIGDMYMEDTLTGRRFLLEYLLPYEIKHLFRSYQERMAALIRVLRKGASTKQGIVDIVAANFGMIGDDPEVRKAKQLIEITEFDPVETAFAKLDVALETPFSITNTNQDPVNPKIKVTLLNAQIESIRNVRIVETKTGKFVEIPLTLFADDYFLIEDTDLIFNGVLSTEQVKGKALELPGNKTVEWHFEAEILSNTAGAYGHFGKYGKKKGDPVAFGDGIFITPEEPLLQVEVLSYELTYGAFSIDIPWHIEGVTDTFAETEDHPRHQIRSLVNKVKASGVRVRVAYHQTFDEQHDTTDHLHFAVQGSNFQERLELEDSFSIDSRLGMKETHDTSDKLKLSGVFDYTEFESGNTFG